MEFGALALDFDGTMRLPGAPVNPELVRLIGRLKTLEVRVILVSGRCLGELKELIDLSLFDAVVVENGAILILNGKRKVLAPRTWPTVRARLLRFFRAGCEEVILSLDRVHEAEAIRRSGTDAQVEANKDRVMIVPKGINKGSGLHAALKGLGFDSVACVGDGENDLSMFMVCDFRIALANSVDALKSEADYVSTKPNGAGVLEAIGALLRRRSRDGRPTGKRTETRGRIKRGRAAP